MSKCASDGCALDPRGCVRLDKILLSFGAPISEEQAWALCYGFAECYNSLSGHRRAKLYLVSSLKHVILHKDGLIHDETFKPVGENCKGRIRASNEGKVVSDLGVVLYRALDFSLGSDEERDLSPTLYKLIDLMTSAEPERGETDDEGIERDSGDSEDEHQNGASFTMKEALKICEDRLSSEGVNKGVEEHYKAVIRALIAEAVDLTFFLQKVQAGTKFVGVQSELLSSEQDLYQLQCEDWARLWKQVMKDLRDGVKLKKVEYTKTPLEYALTPYEMLMEDIRSRRYTLNKVMVNGDIAPRVKKDAHTIILDFIRSRPPLRKASDRTLAPLRKTSSPIELLMDSIRAQDHRLRHVHIPSRPKPTMLIVENHHSVSEGPSPQPRRKLIPAPRLNLSAEDEDDDDLSDVPPSSPRLTDAPLLGISLSTAIHTHASLSTTPASPRSPASPTDKQNPLCRVAYDLATYGNSSVPGRRHSISICETPMGGPNSRSDTSQGSTGPPSRESLSSSPQHHMFASTSKTQRDFLSSAHFSSRLDCLSLTLEEVVHIRNVLTKADLEALPLDLSIKEDVSKGKICFLCMKTRFGFFGPKGRECRLCKRTVCKKCVTKMRIPTEHFSNIPVIMLTPQALSPKDEDDQIMSLPRTFLNMLQDIPRSSLGPQERRSSVSVSVGSAPSSPTSQRSSLGGPLSLQAPSPAPCVTYDIKKAPQLQRSATLSHIEVNNNRCNRSCKRNFCFTGELNSTSSCGVNEIGRNSIKIPRNRFHSYRQKKKSNGETDTIGANNRSHCCLVIESDYMSPGRSCNVLRRSLPPSVVSRDHRKAIQCMKQEIRQRNMEIEEKIRGELMAVCLDCKAMVIHVLLSIKLRRDQNESSSPSCDPARSHLHLDLTPVY